MRAAQIIQKHYYDRNVREENISEGNLVLLKDHRPGTGKFEPRWLGPFKVIKVLSNENYLIDQKKSHTVVHKNRLKTWLNRDPIEDKALEEPADNTPVESHDNNEPPAESQQDTRIHPQSSTDTVGEQVHEPHPAPPNQTENSIPIPPPHTTPYNLRRTTQKPRRYRD